MKENGPISNKPVDKKETIQIVDASQNKIESLEETGRLRLLLDILLEGDLKVFNQLEKQSRQ